jgi:transposase-like protein
MAEKRRHYGADCTREAVRLVTEPGDGGSETARHLGLKAPRLGRWQGAVAAQQRAAVLGNGRGSPDQEA